MVAASPVKCTSTQGQLASELYVAALLKGRPIGRGESAKDTWRLWREGVSSFLHRGKRDGEGDFISDKVSISD